MFVDGVAHDEYYDTTSDLVWVTYRVVVVGLYVILRDFLIFPVTGTRLQVGVGPILQVFRSIRNKAREEGFSHCTLEAERVYENKPGRIISITRRLR
jgi:hypothetical protein